MGFQKGRLVTCDRCGETAFEKECDSLYERAKGWASLPLDRVLCPECNRLWRTVVRKFFNNKSEEQS